MINREDLLSGTRAELDGRILLTVENNFQGYEIVDYRGMVWGISMRSKDAAQDFMMGCKQFTGGELTSYTELADEGRQRAIDRMIAMARRIKANAIINFKFEQNLNTYNSNTEVTAFGNAVVIKPIKNYVPTGGLGNILVEFYDAYTKINQLDKKSPAKFVQESPTGILVKKDNEVGIRCPHCKALYKANITKENGNIRISIEGLNDIDANEPGQQIKCIKCNNIFTVPYSE